MGLHVSTLLSPLQVLVYSIYRSIQRLHYALWDPQRLQKQKIKYKNIDYNTDYM